MKFLIASDIHGSEFYCKKLLEAYKNGKLEEIWGTGTAAVVSPIGQLYYNGTAYTLCGGKIGEVAQKLYDNLTGIQWGKREAPYGWRVEVK